MVSKRSTLTLLIVLGALILVGATTQNFVLAVVLAAIAGTVTWVAMAPRDRA